MTHTDSIVVDIVDGIAETAGVDPVDLEFQLAEYVDTDALEAMAARDGTEWTVRFTVENFVVTVQADDSVTVER